MLRSYRSRRVDDRQCVLRDDRDLPVSGLSGQRQSSSAVVRRSSCCPRHSSATCLDGIVARTLKRRQSVLGGDLDSLADVISFGVAPAVVGYTLGLRGGWDVLCLTYLVVCGVSRLARFNVTAAALADSTTGKVKYFEGTPIPTTIAIVGMWAVAFALAISASVWWFGVVHIGPWMLHPLALLYAASGSAMISATLRVPKP